MDWRSLDFSGGRLNSLRFYQSEVSNCRFDKCQLKDLRLWATTIRDTSFQGADLRESALGAATVKGPLRGKRNTYVGVDFTEADLTGTAYVAAAFERCTFRNTKLVKIDFGTSTFVDCQFEGEMLEVRFSRCGFQGEAFPPNEMVDVDFSRAKLRDVEFRGLRLDRVRLPSDEEHIVSKSFAAVLARLIGMLTEQGDQTAKILAAYLGGYRKWADPEAPGVLNTQDLAEAGDDAVKRVRGLLHQLGVKIY
jgi:hypothetical protein